MVATVQGPCGCNCTYGRISFLVGVVAIVAVIHLASIWRTPEEISIQQLPVRIEEDVALPTGFGTSYGDGLYPVCLVMAIGDDTSDPNERALPYPELYRLFDAAKAELLTFLKPEQSLKDKAPVRLLVGVDYKSLTCRMARDSLRDSLEGELQVLPLTCLTQEDARNESSQFHISPPPASSVGNAEVIPSSIIHCKTMIVGRSSRFVTQLSLDWVELIHWDVLKEVDLDKPDLSRTPPSLPREMWRPTVVTAFSSNHLEWGLLLLRSLGVAGSASAAAGRFNISVVMYALEEFDSTAQGLVDCVLRELIEVWNVPIELRQFNYSAYPYWMKINQTKGYNGGLGEYAWKAAIVHEVMVERGFVIWSDAGGRFHYDGLVDTLSYTEKHGFANRDTGGWVPFLLHPGEVKYFRYDLNNKSLLVQNCDGSSVGFTMDKYSEIVRPWYDCSMTRQCIAPDGSSRENHRQDQSALTLLAASTGNKCVGISPGFIRQMDYLSYEQVYDNSIPPTQCYQDPLRV